jgi:uncharacterized LabA/DUF88 family protein
VTPDEKEQTATSGARRRGTRGGRGRGKRATEEANGVLDDPRVAGRRPASGAAAAKEEEPAKAAAPKRAAAPRRARAKAKPAEEPAKAEPEAEAEAEPKTPTRRRRATSAAAAATETPADGAALAEQVRALRTAVEEQTQTLVSLRDAHDRESRRLRLGVFVDVPNLIYGAERGEGGPNGAVVHMGKLLDYLSGGRELIRATAYSPVSDDPAEPVEQQRFVAPFVRYDYRIVTKPMKRFADGSIKGNFDVEMALDMVTMAERLDVVALVSGDADFARAVELLQGRGVRVEVIAFSGSTSIEMRALADHYVDVATVLDRVGG